MRSPEISKGHSPLTSQVDTNHQLQILSLAPLSTGCLLLVWSPDPVQKPMPQFTRPHSRRGGRGASCRALKPAFRHQARKLQTRFEASFSPHSRRWGWRLPAAGHAAAHPSHPSRSPSPPVSAVPRAPHQGASSRSHQRTVEAPPSGLPGLQPRAPSKCPPLRPRLTTPRP